MSLKRQKLLIDGEGGMLYFSLVLHPIVDAVVGHCRAVNVAK